jgi:hypothetical protein
VFSSLQGHFGPFQLTGVGAGRGADFRPPGLGSRALDLRATGASPSRARGRPGAWLSVGVSSRMKDTTKLSPAICSLVVRMRSVTRSRSICVTCLIARGSLTAAGARVGTTTSFRMETAAFGEVKEGARLPHGRFRRSDGARASHPTIRPSLRHDAHCTAGFGQRGPDDQRLGCVFAGVMDRSRATVPASRTKSGRSRSVSFALALSGAFLHSIAIGTSKTTSSPAAAPTRARTSGTAACGPERLRGIGLRGVSSAVFG